MKYALQLIICVLASTLAAAAETFEYVYRDKSDSTVNCYLKVIPEIENIKGLIIRDFSSLPDISKKSRFKLHILAAEDGIMTIFTTTSKRVPELYYFDEEPALLDDMINEVVVDYNIPKQNIFIGGISASGTRALRFAQYCNEGKSQYGIKIRGVFAVDSPLDLERFYYSALKHRKYFKAGMLYEANLILDKFPKYIGTPEENLDVYRKSSVHSHTDTTLGNAQYYLNTSIIMFHEPDIDWWIKERGASYYDINSFDIAGFVNKQISNGNKDIELVTTSNKGFDREGNRKCHSWTIVDEEYLLNWIVKRMER